MKKFLLVLTLLGLTTLSVQAEQLTVEHSRSREYLENAGYSSATVDLVERSRARAMGEEYESEKPVRGFRKFWALFIDPGMDDEHFMNHDSKVSPTIHDL